MICLDKVDTIYYDMRHTYLAMRDYCYCVLSVKTYGRYCIGIACILNEVE